MNDEFKGINFEMLKHILPMINEKEPGIIFDYIKEFEQENDGEELTDEQASTFFEPECCEDCYCYASGCCSCIRECLHPEVTAMGDVEQYHHFKSVDDIGECKFKFTVEDTDNLEE